MFVIIKETFYRSPGYLSSQSLKGPLGENLYLHIPASSRYVGEDSMSASLEKCKLVFFRNSWDFSLWRLKLALPLQNLRVASLRAELGHGGTEVTPF